MESEANERKRQLTDEKIDDDVQIVADETRPLSKRAHLQRDNTGKHHLLVLITGCHAVASVPKVIEEIRRICGEDRILIKVVATQKAVKLCSALSVEFGDVVYKDKDEWSILREPGNPMLRFELQKWADSALIAPLDGSTLAKLANGIADNLVTSILRCWDFAKPVFCAPSMEMAMWENPLTLQHRNTLKAVLRVKEICATSGTEGIGAMAPVNTISSMVSAMVRDQLAVRSRNF